MNYKKRIKILLILLFSILVLILFSFTALHNNYKAVYYTNNNSQLLSKNVLKNNDILTVHSLDELISKVKKKENVGILIDKSVLQDPNNTKNINNWLLNQEKRPIIVVGYGNPTFTFFKKLLLTKKSNIPPLDEKTYSLYEKQNGFSFAYIGQNKKIYGKGFKEEIKISSIMKVIETSLKGEQAVESMVYRGEY